MTRLLIAFDRPNPYKPGEVLSGSASFTIDKPQTIREVKILLTGIAHTSWTERIGEGRSETKSDTETLASSTVWPIDGLMGDSDLVMPRGQHVCRFSFTIPQKTLTGAPLPGNFKSEDGETYIRYSVKAHVAGSAGRLDIAEEKEVIIADYYDLNEDRLASTPGAVNDGKTICCWCCAAGRIGIMARLPKTGYAVGEFIGLWAEIINQSARIVEKVHVRLVEIGTIKAHPNSNTTLAETSKDQPVIPGQTQFWMNEGVRVPQRTKPSPSTQSCRIIQFSHQLQIDMLLKGCSLDFTVVIPIVIGTVPLVKPTPDSIPPPTVYT